MCPPLPPPTPPWVLKPIINIEDFKCAHNKNREDEEGVTSYLEQVELREAMWVGI